MPLTPFTPAPDLNDPVVASAIKLDAERRAHNIANGLDAGHESFGKRVETAIINEVHRIEDEIKGVADLLEGHGSIEAPTDAGTDANGSPAA
jgi:hypothetical protein